MLPLPNVCVPAAAAVDVSGEVICLFIYTLIYIYVMFGEEVNVYTDMLL